MWTAILSFLGGPIIKGLIDGYKAKLDAGNTSERIAAELAGRELEVQRREAEVEGEYKRALIGHWYEPTNLFGYIMVIYFGKIIVWDKVLKLGVTDSITGQGAEWAGWIMLFYVGKRGFENVARIIRK
jgi:hypothetical protein